MLNKKPTRGRCFARPPGVHAGVQALAALVVLLESLVGGFFVSTVNIAWADVARGVLVSEADAVRIALSRPEVSARIEAEVAERQALAAERGAWSNPEVGYEREQLPGDELEQAVVVSQSIDISGRRRLWRRAAQHHVRSARLRGEASRVQIAADIRARFYAVLYRQTRAEIIASRVTQLRYALGIVARRTAAGDASAYERQRLERELASARIEHTRETLERDRAWTGLATLLDLPAPRRAWPRVAGSLLPPIPMATHVDESNAAEQVSARADVRALDATLDALALEQRTARRGWVPDIGVSLGWRSVSSSSSSASSGDTRHGFVAGLTLSVPLFNRGQWRAHVARARERQVSAQKSLLVREASSTLAVASAQTRRLIATATQFRTDSESLSRRLVHTAETGYAGGELGLLELLDAYRSVNDDALRVVELEYAARTVSVELIAALGKESL